MKAPNRLSIYKYMPTTKTPNHKAYLALINLELHRQAYYKSSKSMKMLMKMRASSSKRWNQLTIKAFCFVPLIPPRKCYSIGSCLHLLCGELHSGRTWSFIVKIFYPHSAIEFDNQKTGHIFKLTEKILNYFLEPPQQKKSTNLVDPPSSL